MNRVGRYLLVASLAVSATGATADTTPYVGFENRQVKALSPDRTGDLLAGRGLGYALAAELNGYPGSLHVLELADKLSLTQRQRSQVQALFNAMRDEAQVLGRAIIDRESDLDHMFADSRVTPPTLERAVAQITDLEGRLRATHLRYHLETRALLHPDQIADYAKLRGYTGDGNGHTKPGHGHGH